MLPDFIGEFEHAYSDQYCDDLVAKFEQAISCGYGVDRQSAESVDKHEKADLALFPSFIIQCDFVDSDAQNVFLQGFWDAHYKKYAEEFSALSGIDPHYIFGVKLQKTKAGEGYHIWHSESSARSSCNRVLAWILYLNDVEDGGETEFLYQRKRIKPKKGTLVIFPAGFTHTHRGNPPLTGDKYILTGWVEM